MRYWILLLTFAAALPAAAYNEIIPAVAYNPSRLGAFTHLKAVDNLSLSSGINTDGGTLNFLANGMIHVSNLYENYSTRCSAGGSCDVSDLDTVGVIEPVGDVENCERISNKCGKNTTVSAGNAVLEGKTGAIYNPGDTSGSGAFLASDAVPYTLNSGVNITLKGNATLTVNNNSLVKSFNHRPAGLTAGETHAGNLYIKNSVKLGNITIPQGVRCNGAKCTRYAFVERVTSNNRRYKVLAAYK